MKLISLLRRRRPQESLRAPVPVLLSCPRQCLAVLPRLAARKPADGRWQLRGVNRERGQEVAL